MRRWVRIGLALLVAVVVTWGASRMPRRSDPASSASTVTRADSTTPPQAWARGQDLLASGRSVDALPYLRRGMVGTLDEFELHYRMAEALRAATIADTVRLGVRGPATRSAYERVLLLREALGHLDRADALARSPAQAAVSARLRALIFANWGQVWDALVVCRAAQATDPTGELGRWGDLAMEALRNPSSQAP